MRKLSNLILFRIEILYLHLNNKKEEKLFDMPNQIVALDVLDVTDLVNQSVKIASDEESKVIYITTKIILIFFITNHYKEPY